MNPDNTKIFAAIMAVFLTITNHGVQARCMVFQGVNWCDNGNSQIDRADGLYTLVGNKLYVEYHHFGNFYDFSYRSRLGGIPPYTYCQDYVHDRLFDHELGSIQPHKTTIPKYHSTSKSSFIYGASLDLSDNPTPAMDNKEGE